MCESIWHLRMNFAFERREMFKDRAGLLKRPDGEVIFFPLFGSIALPPTQTVSCRSLHISSSD